MSTADGRSEPGTRGEIIDAVIDQALDEYAPAFRWPAEAEDRERAQRGPRYADNPKAVGARANARWGYLPCGCENDGFGRHAGHRR